MLLDALLSSNPFSDLTGCVGQPEALPPRKTIGEVGTELATSNPSQQPLVLALQEYRLLARFDGL